LKIHPSDITTIVDDLAARQMVSRDTDPIDRRRNLVDLLPAGRRLVRKATRESQRLSAKILVALSEEERAQVEELLRQALRTPIPGAASTTTRSRSRGGASERS
jgi:DNA-binding MarR family transcriptional regulator